MAEPEDWALPSLWHSNVKVDCAADTSLRNSRTLYGCETDRGTLNSLTVLHLTFMALVPTVAIFCIAPILVTRAVRHNERIRKARFTKLALSQAMVAHRFADGTLWCRPAATFLVLSAWIKRKLSRVFATISKPDSYPVPDFPRLHVSRRSDLADANEPALGQRAGPLALASAFLRPPGTAQQATASPRRPSDRSLRLPEPGLRSGEAAAAAEARRAAMVAVGHSGRWGADPGDRSLPTAEQGAATPVAVTTFILDCLGGSTGEAGFDGASDWPEVAARCRRLLAVSFCPARRRAAEVAGVLRAISEAAEEAAAAATRRSDHPRTAPGPGAATRRFAEFSSAEKGRATSQTVLVRQGSFVLDGSGDGAEAPPGPGALLLAHRLLPPALPWRDCALLLLADFRRVARAALVAIAERQGGGSPAARAALCRSIASEDAGALLLRLCLAAQGWLEVGFGGGLEGPTPRFPSPMAGSSDTPVEGRLAPSRLSLARQPHIRASSAWSSVARGPILSLPPPQRRYRSSTAASGLPGLDGAEASVGGGSAEREPRPEPGSAADGPTPPAGSRVRVGSIGLDSTPDGLAPAAWGSRRHAADVRMSSVTTAGMAARGGAFPEGAPVLGRGRLLRPPSTSRTGMKSVVSARYSMARPAAAAAQSRLLLEAVRRVRWAASRAPAILYAEPALVVDLSGFLGLETALVGAYWVLARVVEDELV